MSGGNHPTTHERLVTLTLPADEAARFRAAADAAGLTRTEYLRHIVRQAVARPFDHAAYDAGAVLRAIEGVAALIREGADT